MEVPAHLRIRMAKRNLSHAYLVVGENRRPLAEALAAAWVCTGETPPCGHCRAAGRPAWEFIQILSGPTQRGRA